VIATMSDTDAFCDMLRQELKQTRKRELVLRDMVPLADAILAVLRKSSVIPCTDGKCRRSTCRLTMELECDVCPLTIVVKRCGWKGAVVYVLNYESYPICMVKNYHPVNRRIFRDPARVRDALNPLLASLEFKRRILALVLTSRHASVSLPPELYQYVLTEFLS
jgi:hypothetical protein